MNLNNIPLWHMEMVWRTDEFQDWWLKRWNDPVLGTMSNIRIGDFFTLGKFNQVCIITHKVIIAGPNPGPELQYDIAGDRGGHWYSPRHEWFEKKINDEHYCRFIPGPSCLAELGKFNWAFGLLEHFRDHPMDNTHRYWKAAEERRRKLKEAEDAGTQDNS